MNVVQKMISIFRKPKVPALPRTPHSAFSTSHSRMYAAAKPTRLMSGFGSGGQSSADTEISSSLRNLRAGSREIIRDAGYAKRAKTIVVDNVIGSGIGLQAQVKTTRGELNLRVNADIEAAWEEWCRAKNCHTGGALHFHDIERFAMGQIFEAGEIFIRKHYRPFGDSSIPFALEVIEPERVIDEFQPSPVDPRAKVRFGVEMDDFHRPIAYWIRTIHPGEVRLNAWEVDRIERVPSDQIIHLRIIDRWPQTRGVPWLHTAIRKLYDMDGYTEAEIVRARAQANTIGGLKTPRQYGEEVKDAAGNVIRREVTSEAGQYEVLYEDEELQFPPVTAPNSTADPFLRFLLREIAAGTGLSYGSLSRDRSQTNYSSERQDLVEDRDLWRIFQLWFIRGFRQNIHSEFLQSSVLSRSVTSISVESFALDPLWYLKVRYKPRGWSWVDPTTEVEAYKEGVKGGLTTLTDVIAKTADGRDIEDILEERAQELALRKQIEAKYGVTLTFDTDPAVVEADIESKKQPPAPKDNSEDIKKLKDNQDQQDKDNANRFGRLMSEIRKVESETVKAINARQEIFNFGDTNVHNTPAEITVNTPEHRTEIKNEVNVPERQTTVNAPVTVNTPEQKTEIKNEVNVPERSVTIDAPVTVNTPENKTEIKNEVNVPERSVTIDAPVTVNTPENKTEIKNEVNVPERSVTIDAPITVNTPEQKTDIKNEFTLPERELHLHTTKSKGKRTIKLKDKDGKVVRTAELEE